jgi:hypothetical protein
MPYDITITVKEEIINGEREPKKYDICFSRRSEKSLIWYSTNTFILGLEKGDIELLIPKLITELERALKV